MSQTSHIIPKWRLFKDKSVITLTTSIPEAHNHRTKPKNSTKKQRHLNKHNIIRLFRLLPNDIFETQPKIQFNKFFNAIKFKINLQNGLFIIRYLLNQRIFLKLVTKKDIITNKEETYLIYK